MRNIHVLIGWLFIATFWLVIAMIGVQYFDQESPVTFTGADFISYSREDQLAVVEFRGVRNRYCPGVIRRHIEDGLIVVLPDIYVGVRGLDPIAIEEGDVYVWRIPIQIPPYSAGDVVYKSEVLYACNSLQHFLPLRVEAPEIHFYVPGRENVQELLQGGG